MDMRTLAMVLLEKLGGEAEITEKELVALNFYGQDIIISDPDITGTSRVVLREVS